MTTPGRSSRVAASLIGAAAILATLTTAEADQKRIALADIYYLDTSGEPGERAAEHAARTRLFQRALAERLERDGTYEVVPLACGKPDCSIGSMTVEEAVDAAGKAGADYALLGAIQKISTLIGTGRIDMVEIASKRDVVSRVLSFRGDTDEAFERAAEFAARSVLGADLAAAEAGQTKAAPPPR